MCNTAEHFSVILALVFKQDNEILQGIQTYFWTNRGEKKIFNFNLKSWA